MVENLAKTEIMQHGGFKRCVLLFATNHDNGSFGK